MSCNCCGKKLNSGMLKKIDTYSSQVYKACPRCSDTHGEEHIFHPYPSNFGTTPARVTPNNPDGHQSHCNSCRTLDARKPSVVFSLGKKCSSIS